MISYTKSALTSLGINYSASHTEIRLTDNGPVIIESGARTMGLSIDETILKDSLGYSQVELTAYSYIDIDTFLKKYNSLKKRDKKLRITFLISDIDGVLNPKITDVNNLSTVVKTNIISTDGNVYITNDPMKHPGWIYQVSDSWDDIEKDFKKIRMSENVGEFYIQLVKN